jgi:hypothetical protein
MLSTIKAELPEITIACTLHAFGRLLINKKMFDKVKKKSIRVVNQRGAIMEILISEIENFLLVCEKCCLPDGVAKQVKLCKNKGSDKWTCYGDNLSNFLLEHGGCPASGITIKALSTIYT